MKKLAASLLAIVVTVSMAGVSDAASRSGSFSGGSKPPVSSQSPATGSVSGSTSGSSSVQPGGSQVHSSGAKSPSGNVTQKPSTSYQQPYQQPSQPKSSWFGGGIGRFLGGMAAGALLTSVFSHMFHPFGGLGSGFSIWWLLIDAFLLFLAYKLIRKLFFR